MILQIYSEIKQITNKKKIQQYRKIIGNIYAHSHKNVSVSKDMKRSFDTLHKQHVLKLRVVKVEI